MKKNDFHFHYCGNVQNMFSCPICYVADDQSITITTCRHSFHTICLQTWLKKHDTCPMCRREIPSVKHDEKCLDILWTIVLCYIIIGIFMLIPFGPFTKNIDIGIVFIIPSVYLLYKEFFIF